MLTAIAALFIATFVLPISANAKGTSYGFNVENTTVTTDNYNNITSDYIKPYNTSLPCKAYYVPSTKTLYLENVKIERSGNNNRCIINKTCDGLTVVFKGGNYFFAKNASAIRCEKNTTLKQATGASVTVSSKEQEAIFACNTASLTINNGIFTCASDKKDIIGGNGKEKLTLDNTTITGSTYYLRSIVSDFDKVMLINSTIKGETSSTPVSGIHVYLPKSSTAIKVYGTNNIETLYTGIVAYSRTTIKGTGTLNITSKNGDAIGTSNPQLTFDGCTVNAKGKWGIRGLPSFKGHLAFTNANVTINSSEACISNIKSLTLDGCTITQPSGAAFSTSLYGMALGGTLVKGKVLITKGATGIASPTADIPAKKCGIYNLQGVRLGDRLDRLPAGIYIVDGRKEVKK
ncbi:MAG: hypothetical protein ACLRV7_07060 [Hoylesella buccalis]|uniref:Peptidase n=1 Tax=Hoylesella buccalis TaxID=28127 RepID=A0A2N6QNE2_9BACT|nr:hypothetical protein [Hoylesella buccalis]PMC23043.1 hypothetical protein CJ231_11370 [Hoylesella buccalis]